MDKLLTDILLSKTKDTRRIRARILMLQNELMLIQKEADIPPFLTRVGRFLILIQVNLKAPFSDNLEHRWRQSSKTWEDLWTQTAMTNWES